MQLEAAIQDFVKATQDIDESRDQVVLLPELYRLLQQYVEEQQNKTEQEKLLESIHFKIEDCLIRYHEHDALSNALKQLKAILGF